MIPAQIPDNEPQRLEKLYELNILDTLEEQEYDDITHLIAQICDTPIALISLIDKDRQFLKSRHGLDATEVSRELGFCPHAILDDEVTVIEDATQDERFHDNPLVTSGPQVKFYAGAPLIMSDNIRLGTLCVVAHEPRTITDDQKKALQVLARQVVSQLELRQTVQKLEIASKSKSDFLSSMSHELRTPMNAILGFGQLLEMSPKEPLSQNQKRCVDQIMKSGHHLLELINDVLDLTKIEEDNIEISVADVSALSVIDDCLSLIESSARERGIEVHVANRCKAATKVRADHMRFKQSLLNLLSNAVKYNCENGKITIDCHDTSNATLHLSITDTGKGIPDDMLIELFEPFNRLGAEMSGIEGTGIGLTITKKLIESMEGHIGVESHVDEGSTFWIELPLAKDQPNNATSSDSEPNHDVEHTPPDVAGHVLYVEDNPDNLKLMEMILEAVEGVEMISAHTAEQGIQMAKEMQPDLIILDINLPGMSGMDALKVLQQTDQTKNIPVFAMTANAMPLDVEMGLKAGFQKYLTKPIQVQDVVGAITDVLEKTAPSLH